MGQCCAKSTVAPRQELFRVTNELHRVTEELERMQLDHANQAASVEQEAVHIKALTQNPRSDTPAERDGGENPRWTSSSWVASTNPSTIIAAALCGAAESEDVEVVRALAQSSRDEMRARLGSGGVLDALADKLHASARELLAGRAGAPAVPLTAAELTSKFVSEDGAATLSFGGLKSFFGGLEAAVGTPSPRVREAMQREHCSSKDSTDQLVASNCAPRHAMPQHSTHAPMPHAPTWLPTRADGIITTSCIEWWFAAEPTEEALRTLGLEDWPKEDPTRLTYLDRRKAEPLDALREKLVEVNGRLQVLERRLAEEELLAAKLYTGPMFMKCAPLPTD